MTTTGEPDAPEADVDGADEATEPREPTEAQLRQLAAALHNLDDDSLRRGLNTMRESSRQEVAQHLNLTKATMHLGDALVPVVRRKLTVASAPHQLATAFALTEQTNEVTIAALGERHDDPTRDDMIDVLPGVVEDQGTPLVALMLAAYTASDAQCSAVFEELLATDDRFVLPDPPDVDADAAPEPSGIVTFTRDADDPAQVAKRAQRKEAKAAKRAAAAARQNAADAAQSARREAQHRANQRPGRR